MREAHERPMMACAPNDEAASSERDVSELQPDNQTDSNSGISCMNGKRLTFELSRLHNEQGYRLTRCRPTADINVRQEIQSQASSMYKESDHRTRQALTPLRDNDEFHSEHGFKDATYERVAYDVDKRHISPSKRLASNLSGRYLPDENRGHPNRDQNHAGSKYQPQSSPYSKVEGERRTSSDKRLYPITANLPRSILTILFVNAIINHLFQMLHPGQADVRPIQLQLFPHLKLAHAEFISECVTERDCEHPDKICYENKCICRRARPIEDKERSECLPHASINEPCSLNEQCLGHSVCSDGYCSCSKDQVLIFNPSIKQNYCHPIRQLHEECNYDSQCPENSFCSTKKYGCMCQNGYGSSLVRNASGIELTKCLPKVCRVTSECESEYHICDENKCKCLATHFDPLRAECYKFGSTGGQLGDGNTTILDGADDGRGLTSAINDLVNNGDKWLIIIVLSLLTLIFLVTLILVLRKYYLGYCWTHTKEYEPNNENSPKNGAFEKNSINNKSFRKKNGEMDDDEACSGDDTAADRSNLVNAPGKKNGGLIGKSALVKTNGGDNNVNENHYVRVDMRVTTNEETDGNQRSTPSPSSQYRRSHQQVISRPLPSSTSTPV